MSRIKYPMSHEWHVCCNAANPIAREGEKPQYMYEAAQMADEVPRMAMLFKQERESPLSTNQSHLACCKGIKCSECPALLALEKMKRVTPEQIDEAKAWTCAAHIVSTGGDIAREGYLGTAEDRTYWDRTYDNLAGNQT